PLGIIHAPACLFRQNGPPGLVSMTSIPSGPRRNSRMPALCGDGILFSLSRSDRLGDRTAAEQPGAVIDDRRLARSDAKLGPREAHALAVQARRHRRRERADLDGDMALLLAEPVPALDAHCLDRQRAARADHDPPILGRDPHDVERLLLATDLD